jgi:hypothetical protein
MFMDVVKFIMTNQSVGMNWVRRVVSDTDHKELHFAGGPHP